MPRQRRAARRGAARRGTPRAGPCSRARARPRSRSRRAQLTFRDLKTHISEQLRIPYAALKLDALSAVIEDASDAVANACESGSVPLDECMRKLGLRKDEV